MAILLRFTRTSLPWENEPSTGSSITNRINSLQAPEDEIDRTVWAKEMLAQRCGRTFESLWNSINASTNKLSVAANFPFGKIVLPHWAATEHLAHGIEMRVGDGPGEMLSPAQWRQQIQNLSNDRWQLENIEFRHNRFEVDTNGAPSQSGFYFSAHLTSPGSQQRAMLEGDLLVNWENLGPGDTPATVKRIDATHLQLKTRTGEPFFRKILDESFSPTPKAPVIDPLIVYDLDGDGFPEILLPAINQVYRRREPEHYEPEPLCRYPLDFIMTAVVADFDGDGHADLLCATPAGLFLFKGSPQGTFDEPPRNVWTPHPALKDAMVLTCGDIDEDGDLDVFLGQYRVPPLGAILRPYYYDANDGFPSYLLLNDGHGNFTDVTEGAGLGRKRWRRTYSASFADLDNDGHLDLLVVSDFAGLDLYRGDGHGHFVEVTHQWVSESHEFGMAHCLADFNVDGRLDLLMIGMPSPTVDRLQHLNLWREYTDEDRLRRPAMTFGNRLFLAKTNGGFEQTAFGDSIARSGWSWGCSAFDFDNDGFPDVYIANGLETKQSVRDYEGEFWLHDVFINEKADDISAGQYYQAKFRRTRGSGWSYGGYEKNRLFLSQGGESFTDIGHLAGVSLEEDSRNVVADDLDGDGRVDLLVTTFEVWPEQKRTLKIFKNQVRDAGHWIGFGFREEGSGKSPVGCRVTIHYNGRSATRELVTGDSHRSQAPNTIHFGLGNVDRVDSAEIRWVEGGSRNLTEPAIDKYHRVEWSVMGSGR
ncbi:MAG TPA: CRTAC1 family protein [Verrucomicrobiae bacterium]|nr:CRTAC1 family protein [Verrucomicrobiae bacterium]